MKFDTIPFNYRNNDLITEYKNIINLYKIKRNALKLLSKDTIEKLDNYIYINYISKNKKFNININNNNEFRKILYNPYEINIDIKSNYFKHLFYYPYICIEQNTPIRGLSKHHLQYPYRDEYFRIVIFDCWNKEEQGFIKANIIDTPEELKKDNNEYYCKKLYNYYKQSNYKDKLEYKESWIGLTLNEKIKKILYKDNPKGLIYKNCSLFINL
jgi:hypothetical protein